MRRAVEVLRSTRHVDSDTTDALSYAEDLDGAGLTETAGQETQHVESDAERHMMFVSVRLPQWAKFFIDLQR